MEVKIVRNQVVTHTVQVEISVKPPSIKKHLLNKCKQVLHPNETNKTTQSNHGN